MTHLTDVWVVPWLTFLADWSIRWAVVLAPVAAWLGLRPPRRTALRYAVCLGALAAGVALPIAPRWGLAVVRWPSWVERGGAGSSAIESPRDAIAFPVAHAELEASGRERERQVREDSHRREPPVQAAGPSRSIEAADPLIVWRLAALGAAGVWAAVVIVLISRLACGWLMVAGLRRGAVEVAWSSDGLLGECRTALGLSRHVGLAVHPAVASPVVVGGLRPLVLVPADWGDWPEAHRRACLLHELAHLARYDDWAKLFQELLRAAFFFHPLVRWLLTRLDRERELLCDEAAVGLGSDPIAYARLLLELARRSTRLSPITLVSRPGWLPFLDQRTVEVRIERLLEKDMRTTLSRISRPRVVALLSLAVATALGIGGLRLSVVSAQQADKETKPGSAARSTTSAPKVRTPDGPRPTPEALAGVVLGPDDRPVAGAMVIAGSYDPGRSGHEVITTGADGRFNWRVPKGTEFTCLIAHQKGLSAVVQAGPAGAWVDPLGLELRLAEPEPFAAVLVDGEGKPMASANVRVTKTAHATASKQGQATMVSTGFEVVPWEVVAGSPLENLFSTTTGTDGSFIFTDHPPGSGLMLLVTGPDGRTWRVKSTREASELTRRIVEDQGFVMAPPGESTRLLAIAIARVAGRVVSTLPEVGVAGLTVLFGDSHQPGMYRPTANSWGKALTDAQGRFAFEGLGEGTINIYVRGEGENKQWTYLAAKDVDLVPGRTSEVKLEIIRGVEVEGTIVADENAAPVEGAQVGVYGPNRPRTSAMTTGAMTDARGRYRYRLPSGETYFYVMGAPPGFTRLPGEASSRTVNIPEGVSRYEVPPIKVAAAVTVRGKVLNAVGAPIAGATVVGICEGNVCRPFPGAETVTDSRGEFRLPPGMYNTVAVGKTARLLIRLRDGAEHEAAAVPAADGAVAITVPIGGETPRGVEGPRDVAPGELAGVVVDTDGKPVEGAEVDAWTWYPGNEARTDAKGSFRIGNLVKDRKVEVVVRKPGYTPQLFLTQPTGEPGWVIVLGKKTYFEGRVTAPDGKPVAGALIRANNGPKRADGVTITEIWTEAKTGDDGRYRMHAQADVYDLQVRVPGIGVARLPGTALGTDEAKRLDIHLERGVTFRAKLIDSLTGEPVPGVRLWHWQHPGIEGRSGQDGVAEIPDMMPGRFQFQVEAPNYARWWSDEAATEWSRRQLNDTRGGWQRNFDPIDFDLTNGMGPATITLERGVTVSGRVLDPDGKPVVGATVAPALTGSGNSLTGDTRFSVETSQDGKFTVTLPASGTREYNLIAHDGKFRQWRTWANGVLPPFRTKPGETIRDVEIRLTRPATVRGRVTDADGRPVAGREVRASAADRKENRYYDPTTKTSVDGNYELKFIRPGDQLIQVAPFWLDARQAPEGTSREVKLTEGESKEGVDFRVDGRTRAR